MQELIKVADLFEIRYGVNLELVRLEQCQSTDFKSIPFVSRTGKNNGVSAYVYELIDVVPNPKHTLSVAVGGSVLSTFYQPKDYYTGFHVLVLTPKNKMSVLEMLFYAKCISVNKYRYSYGRQANKTLRDLLIPKGIDIRLLELLNNYSQSLNNKLEHYIKSLCT